MDREVSSGRTENKGLPRLRMIRRFLIPALLVLGAAGFLVFSSSARGSRTREMNGMMITVPEGYTCSFSDSRYMVWEYKGSLKPGRLVLDAEIRNETAEQFATVDDVMRLGDWMTDRELYVNPNGIRMVRGYADYSGMPERRYYVEGAGSSVFLICMIESPQYYSMEDCEAVLLQTADSIVPKR